MRKDGCAREKGLVQIIVSVWDNRTVRNTCLYREPNGDKEFYY
jgi:hypothetical protein